ACLKQNTNVNYGIGWGGHQKWYLIQMAAGAITSTTPFKIMNLETGMFLEAPNSTSGSLVQQNSSHGFPSEIWYFVPVAGQSYYIIKNANGLVLTNQGGSTADGNPITEETLTNTTKQYWNLNAMNPEAYRDDAVVGFFRRTKVTNTTVAFDQGNSIPLNYGANNGKVLWIAQDSDGADKMQADGSMNCDHWSYHNSGLLQPTTTNWSSTSTPNITTTSNTGTGISQLEIVKDPITGNRSTYCWPAFGVEINSDVYVWTWEASYDGSWANNQVLNKIAENTGGTNWGAVTRLTPAGMSGQSTILYSSGMNKKPALDTVYVWGTKSVFFGTSIVYLARFPLSNPTNWSYWRGNSWASTPDLVNNNVGAITVGSGVAVQQNVSVSYVNGKYVMMQMDMGFFCDPGSHGIYISTATKPMGPFTAPQLVYTIEDKYNGHIAKYYTPIIHPEFVNGKNELLVTYALNYNADGGSCSTQICFSGKVDPNFYQLKAVRIPYSLIGI
ncbi:MAG: RICIN domain-containing protein, partial [Mucilaginibacter sp.]